MLRYLKISNLAIIDEVEVEFQEGLNILTGETGAGKSILIGALNLLLGAKTSPDIIRTGESEASVEGLFEIEDPDLLPNDLDDKIRTGGEIILARRVFRSGRSRCSINGNMATLSTLESVGRMLVSIFGQHSHQRLLAPDEHREILDRFGDLLDLRANTSRAYSTWTRAVREAEIARKDLADREAGEREREEAVEELAEANLKSNEEEGLAGERDLLRKSVQIREKAFEAHQLLYSRSGSILETCSDVRRSVDYLASVNPALAKTRENLEDAVYRLEDVALELRDVAEKAQSDPTRLDRIEERLGLIRRLKKKYGVDLEGLLAYQESLEKESGEVLDARASVKKLETLVSERHREYLDSAGTLSNARKKAAAKLEKSLKKELTDLAMAQSRFEVRLAELPEDKSGPLGRESVEFFLSSNPGETPKQLARIASGGELSRIMLALKALQVDRESAPTVIFDEVDAGIGGHTAAAVGSRLARVARSQQLLCITHLHQVAALADHHLSVKKVVTKGRTRICVDTLDEELRVEELARMLGASPESETAREHARDLVGQDAAEASG